MIELEQIINKLETAIRLEQKKLVKMRLVAEKEVKSKSERDHNLEVLGRIEAMLGGVSASLSKLTPDYSEILEKIDKIEFPEVVDRTPDVLDSINNVAIELTSFANVISNLRNVEKTVEKTVIREPVDRVVEKIVEVTPPANWNFEIVRENGLISNVIARRDG